ncbi:MAG TPA: sugar transferase [Thermoleophilaceae bacterium]|nr:sugar transferase [Thermoleophilaceae bacterium]
MGAVDAFDGSPSDAPPERLPTARRRSRAGLLEGRSWTVVAIGADALMLLLAVGAALLGAEAAGVHAPAWPAFLFPPLVIGLLAIRGVYRAKITIQYLDELGHVVGACSVAAMSIIAVSVFTADGGEHAKLLARVWVFGMIYVAGSHYVLHLTQRRARIERSIAVPTLIFGAGKIGAAVERRLDEKPELGLRPIGYVDPYPPSDEQVPGRRVPVLGSPEDLESIVARTGAKHVVMAFMSSRGSDATLVPVVRKCDELGLDVSLVPRLFESINVRVKLEHIGGMPLYRLRAVNPKGWQFAIKHAMDRVMAALLILLLAPLLLAATAAVRISSPGPIFFRQRRVGRDGRPFDLLKFRSMRTGGEPRPSADNVRVLLPDDTAPGGVEGVDRRTAIGKLLRRTSIDELPQLFNVLKGEMSVVGPRPERPEFVELFERRVSRYDDRHRVRAGITGWAQVHGLRGKTSLSDRIEWDNYYIENWSLWLDLKILLLTVAAVFKPAE